MKEKQPRKPMEKAGERCLKCGSINTAYDTSQRLVCLECRNEKRKERERGLIKPKRSAGENFKRAAMVAALAGAGVPTANIAERVGMKKDAVEQLLRKKVAQDAELQGILQAARDEIAGDAIEAAKLAVKTMTTGLSGYKVSAGIDKETGEARLVTVDCPPDKAATVFRELRPVLGFDSGMPGDGQGARPAVQINLNDPAVAAAAIRALAEMRQKAQRALEPPPLEVKGERVL